MADKKTPSPLTKETLAAAAGRDDAAMKELLRGEEGERGAQVDRARLALGMLQGEMSDAKKEEKARIARSTRELMDEHLPAVQAELHSGANVKLSELEKKIEETRATAVLEERATMNTLSVDTLSYDAQEITRELQKGDWKTWAMYGGIAVGAGLAAKWAWDHSIGWLWSKAAGNKEKPGFLRRAAGWLTAVAGAGAAAVGFHYWRQNGSKFTATGDAFVDIPAGAANVVTKDISRIATLVDMDARLLQELLESENWEKFWDVLSAKGVDVAYQHGEVVLMVLGEAVTMPLQFGRKLINRMTTGKWDKDTWLVYGEAGAAYFIGKQTLKAILKGNARLPLTLADGLITVYQVGAWPLDMATDIYKATNTLVSTGGRGVVLRYLAPTWPMRYGNATADVLLAPNCRTTDGIVSALQRWKRIQADCDIAAKSPSFFDADTVKTLNDRRAAMAGKIQEGLKNVAVADDAPDYIKTLHQQAKALGLENFESKMDDAIVAGKVLLTPDTAAVAPKAPGPRAPTSMPKKPAPTAPSATPTAKPPVVADAAETADEWTEALSKMKKSILAPDAADDLVEAFEAAARRAKTIGMPVQEAMKMLGEGKTLYALSTIPDESIGSLAAAFKHGGAPGVRRVTTFISSIGDSMNPTVLAGMLDDTLIKTIASADVDPAVLARIGSSKQLRTVLAGRNVDQVKTLVKNLLQWEKMTSVSNIIRVGGIALSAAMLGMDILTYREMRERLNKTIGSLETSLRKAHFEKIGDEFVHPRTKTRIGVKALTASIDNLSTEQSMRVAADAAGLVALLIPNLAMGPAGLVVMAVELTVHAGLMVAEDDRSRQFLLDTPTEVLALIGMSQTVGKSEKDTIDGASSWLFSDALYATKTNDAEKRTMRKKAFAILFFQEVGRLAKDDPALAQEILGGHDAATFLDEENGTFFNKDFDAVIKPFLAARLFQRSGDASVSWSRFRDLRVDEGITDWENVGIEDMRLALRDAAPIYAQHLRERRYRDTRDTTAKRLTLLQTGVLGSRDQLATRAHEELSGDSAVHNTALLAEQSVFGARLKDLPADGPTQAERYVQSLTTKLDTVSKNVGTSYDLSSGILPTIVSGPITGAAAARRSGMKRDMLKADPTLFTVPHPNRPGETIALRSATVSARTEIDEPLTDESFDAMVGQATAAYDGLKDFNNATIDHVTALRTVVESISRFPRLQAEPEVAAFAKAVRALTETYAWDASVFPGPVTIERSRAVRAAVAQLGTLVDRLEARRYHAVSVDRSKARQETVNAPGVERVLFIKPAIRHADLSKIMVVVDGKEQICEALPGDKKEHEIPEPGTGPSIGKLICRSKKFPSGGKNAFSYIWSFVRDASAKPGASFYAYALFEGDEQPGVTVTLPTVETREYVAPKIEGQPDRLIVPTEASVTDAATIVYMDASGNEHRLSGMLRDIWKNDICTFREITQASTKKKMMELLPKPGMTLIRLELTPEQTPLKSVYRFQKESLVQRRIRERQAGGGDDGSVASSL